MPSSSPSKKTQEPANTLLSEKKISGNNLFVQRLEIGISNEARRSHLIMRLSSVLDANCGYEFHFIEPAILRLDVFYATENPLDLLEDILLDDQY